MNGRHRATILTISVSFITYQRCGTLHLAHFLKFRIVWDQVACREATLTVLHLKRSVRHILHCVKASWCFTKTIQLFRNSQINSSEAHLQNDVLTSLSINKKLSKAMLATIYPLYITSLDDPQYILISWMHANQLTCFYLAALGLWLCSNYRTDEYQNKRHRRRDAQPWEFWDCAIKPQSRYTQASCNNAILTLQETLLWYSMWSAVSCDLTRGNSVRSAFGIKALVFLKTSACF